ncbi:protein HESO1 [Vigna unguiculata]|uniref:Poly n=1 Tax=Vigna unguiculata TaxID=3917 RepID=A0A4D6MAS4_VIGUN|nr:protein HESO1 [Vigna unguiculata]XP_027940472.1 protein HESO1 [Vigna unguiculata]QCD98522.1 poly [Vigna unguiculata]
MSTHSMLDTALNDILQVVTPLQEDWQIRFSIINDLRSIVESVESLRGATVEPFGSFVSNLFTRWGDLDISIELSNGLHISSAGKKQKQNLLGEVLKALRMKGVGSHLQFIPNARVPILKFKSNRQGISCDISINNLPGQMKSKILLWMNKIDGRFHDMVLLVKEWAKAHKINNSKTGTFNSYSLSLLVIFHFQTCVPAILPPLKYIYPGNMADDLKGVRADAENHIAETCNASINEHISNKARSINKKSVPDLFVEFLRKYAQMDSWASNLGICPYTGQWEQIENNTIWLPKTYSIFVEDPFEQPQNTARSVSAGQLKKISEAFSKSYSFLSSNNHNLNSLLTMLAPPHVVKSITGIQNYNGSYFHPTQPKVQRVMRPPPQSQHHFQYGSPGTSSNSSASNGHMQMPRGTNFSIPSSNGYTQMPRGTSFNIPSSYGHIPMPRGTSFNIPPSNGHIQMPRGASMSSSSSNGHIQNPRGTKKPRGTNFNIASSNGHVPVNKGQQMWRPKS